MNFSSSAVKKSQVEDFGIRKAPLLMGKHEYGTFVLCGTQYRQQPDFSVLLDQREYVENLSPSDLKPDDELRNLKDHEPITIAKWLKRFRGANGALQWLCTNTRPDLAAETSISAGTSGIGITKASILNAQKSSERPTQESTLKSRFDTSLRKMFDLQRFMMLDGHLAQTDAAREATLLLPVTTSYSKESRQHFRF